MGDFTDWAAWGLDESEAQELYVFAQERAKRLVYGPDLADDTSQQMLWACFACLKAPPATFPTIKPERIAYLKTVMTNAGKRFRDRVAFDGPKRSDGSTIPDLVVYHDE